MRKPTTPTKTFMVLISSCGGIEQAIFSEYGDGTNEFSSIDKAKASIAQIAQAYEENEGDTIRAAWIVEIVSSGKSSGFSWDK